MTNNTKKNPKLRGKAKTLASKYVAEEVSTRKYPLKQAVAIGISRARSEAKESRTVSRLKAMLKRYRA